MSKSEIKLKNDGFFSVNRRRALQIIIGFSIYVSDFLIKKEKYPKISFCTTAKGRLHHIKETFISNILNNIDYPNVEFVLLDYNCPDGLEEWARKNLKEYIQKGIVNYYKCYTPKLFDAPHAKNMAARLSKGDIVCNIDADDFVGKEFAFYVADVLKTGCNFICSSDDDRKGLFGLNAVWKKHFFYVGGYDESMTGRGWQDCDYYARLGMIKLKKISTDRRYVDNIQHNNFERTRFQEMADLILINKKNCIISEYNKRNRISKPNNSGFGKGRVKKNFSEWIELK